jgi:hypothetical protein
VYRKVDAHALAARFDLVLGFFAGAVENRTERPREVRGRLQQQRRLADPRFAAEEHQRPWHHTAAEHAIELADARRQPFRDHRVDVRVQLRTRRPRQAVPLRNVGGRGRALRDGALLDERVPGATLGAASQPLLRLCAALLAGEHCLLLHVAEIPNPLSLIPNP